MDSFHFNSVADLLMGPGTSAQLGDVLTQRGLRQVFIVTDASILQLGLPNQAIESLNSAGIRYQIYSDVMADPSESVVLDAMRLAQTFGCDGVVGFGGGSSMDVAKILAVLIGGDQSLSDIYGVDQISGKRLPLVQIPTTAGTGSEATMVSIITTGQTTKAGVVSRALLADQIILDANLTLGLPAHITAATGMDAMVHAIEAFTSKRLKNPLSDLLALAALDLLSQHIETAVKTGSDIKARESMLLGSMLAGQAFANAPVAAVHALAYPLGGHYHLPHGLTNAVMLPHVLRFNAAACPELYQTLAKVILPDHTQLGVGLEPAEKLAAYLMTLAEKLGLPISLQQLNIPKSDLPTLAEAAMLQQRLLINNPRSVSYEDALAIYHHAF